MVKNRAWFKDARLLPYGSQFKPPQNESHNGGHGMDACSCVVCCAKIMFYYRRFEPISMHDMYSFKISSLHNKLL